jgi:hypothetical protein
MYSGHIGRSIEPPVNKCHYNRHEATDRPPTRRPAVPSKQPPDNLSEELRQEIYQALADEQDLYEFTLQQARQRIASRYGITDKQLLEIESEGREKLWPPY